MRKIICFTMSLIITITSLSVAFAINSDIDSLSMEEASAYGEVLDDITSEIKSKSSDNLYTLNFKSDMPFGMSFADLIDFDSDNIKELFVFYMHSGKYVYDIWTLDDGYAYRVYQGTSQMKSTSKKIYLADRDEGAELIIVDNDLEGIKEAISIFTMSNGKWQNTRTYKITLSGIGINGSTVNTEKYISVANGTENEITKQEYDATYGLYVNDALNELYNYNASTGELYINRLKTNINQADKLNQLASEANAFVNSIRNKSVESYTYSNVISSLSKEEKKELTSIITYFAGLNIDGNVNLTKPYNSLVEFVAYKTAFEGNVNVLKSTEIENFIMVDKMTVDFEFFKKFGFYPNEVYYNNNSTIKNFSDGKYYHLANASRDNIKYSFQPDKMYKISDTIFMVPFSVYIWDSTSPSYSKVDVNDYISEWADGVKNSAIHDKNGYAIIERTSFDDYPYFILEMAVGTVYPTEEYLEGYLESDKESVLAFNYKIKKNELKNYLDEAEKQLLVFDDDNSVFDNEEITRYFEFSYESLASATKRAKRNTVSVNVATLNEMQSKLKEATTAFDDLLDKSNVTLDRDAHKCAKVFISNASSKKPVTVEVPKALLNTEFDSIKFVLAQNNFCVEIPKSEIEKMYETSKEVKVKIEKDADLYKITFINNGKETEKIDGKVKISIPSGDRLDTVCFTNDEYDETIGGQYNFATEAIEFYASYTGEYELDNLNVSIDDIDTVSKEEKEKIEFLVSKDIMGLDDKKFNPQNKMTRNDVAKAITKMLYLVDFESKADFVDVDDNDDYFRYIASSVENKLLGGFEDGEFKGDGSITREALISLTSRIINSTKHYNTDFKLNYDNYFDYFTISSWDDQDSEIALVSALGMINDKGLLLPRSDVTRLECANILYDLYNHIYNTHSLNTLTNSNSISQIGILIGVLALLVIIIVVIVAVVIKVRRKRA